jgi:hypothetical protein
MSDKLLKVINMKYNNKIDCMTFEYIRNNIYHNKSLTVDEIRNYIVDVRTEDFDNEEYWLLINDIILNIESLTGRNGNIEFNENTDFVIQKMFIISADTLNKNNALGKDITERGIIQLTKLKSTVERR